MTPAVEIGYRPADPGGPPIWHYRMAPGVAVLLDDAARTATPVEVTRAMARRARDAHILKWLGGQTVVLFDLDGKRYAQLFPVGKPEKPARVREAKPARPKLSKVKKRRPKVGLL